jgi:phosphatidylserine/phosphatidylglycerophosphate/cardiolipin synthase-like enzyme
MIDMVEFLHTNDIISQVSHLIDEAKEKIVLISPYLDIPKNIQHRMKNRGGEVPLIVVYNSESAQNPRTISSDTITFLQQLQRIEVKSLAELHAKCYLNEDKAIITSMNLYSHSSKVNYEMGVLIDRKKDTNIYFKTLRAAEQIIQAGNTIFTQGEITGETPSNVICKEETGRSVPEKGFCIRCGTTIPLDPERPYCIGCFYDWDSKGGNPYYKEKYCHGCGHPTLVSLEKPLCNNCYWKYH